MPPLPDQIQQRPGHPREPFDIWNVIAVPVCWIYLLRNRAPIRVPYALSLWLILGSSLVATVFASDPAAGMTVIVKELYLFFWFVTVLALLNRFDGTARRRLLMIWCGTAVVHGAVLIAQFVSPELLELMTTGSEYRVYRPQGLFRNANAAALFQLLGFVPLWLLGLDTAKSVAVGTFIFVSAVSTGSLSTFAVFILVTAVIMGITPFFASVRSGVKTAAVFAIASLLVAIAFSVTFLRSSESQERLEYLFYGRAERSAAGRFILWAQAQDLMMSGNPLWGIGPRNFADDQLGGKSLHNDFLSFLVERGLVGAFGLALLAATALSRPLRILLGGRSRTPGVAIFFLAVWLGLILQSQTHQIFHARSLWLALAFQEMVLGPSLRSRRLLQRTEVPKVS